MKDLNAAYQVLSSPEKRTAYDSLLERRGLPDAAEEFEGLRPECSVKSTSGRGPASPLGSKPGRRTGQSGWSFVNVLGAAVFTLCTIGFVIALWAISWVYVALIGLGAVLISYAVRVRQSNLSDRSSEPLIERLNGRPRPWTRFFARLLDIQIFMVVLLLIIQKFAPELDDNPDRRAALLLVSPVLWVGPASLS